MAMVTIWGNGNGDSKSALGAERGWGTERKRAAVAPAATGGTGAGSLHGRGSSSRLPLSPERGAHRELGVGGDGASGDEASAPYHTAEP